MELRSRTQITRLSALELAAAIAAGDVSSVESVDAYVARIERVDPKLNAVVHERFSEARAEAERADAELRSGSSRGPLHGVPISVKECLDVAGTPSTFGLASRAHDLASEDDRFVRALRDGGAIVLAKTNVAQLLAYIETDNPLFGRTNNPWNLERSPGGSSGGEAALIAACASPLGLGTDIGGSIRVPASSCGIVGLKPTAGRFKDRGRYSFSPGQRGIVSQVGTLARTVHDVAAAAGLLDAVRDEPTPPLADHRGVVISQLRVAVYDELPGLRPAPAVRRAVGEAAALLEQGGATVEQWQPPDAAEAQDVFFGILAADGGRTLRATLGRERLDSRLAQILGVASKPRWFVRALAGALRAGGQATVARVIGNYGFGDTAHYWSLIERQRDYRKRFARALASGSDGPFDVIVGPSFPLPAMRHGQTKDLAVGGPYNVLYNVLGYPAGVIPMTHVRSEEEVERPPSRDGFEAAARSAEIGSAGLPVGVQVIARPWCEHNVLAVMAYLETARAPFGEYPDP